MSHCKVASPSRASGVGFKSQDWLINRSGKLIKRAAMVGFLTLLAAGCTQETQNKISRSLQNWTGTDGVLEIYAGNTLVKRFMKIDKLSTAMGTDDGRPRAYRFGYGVLDENLNAKADAGEKKVYFEISDYATFYVFYEAPK